MTIQYEQQKHLVDFEERIDPYTEELLRNKCCNFIAGKYKKGVFIPPHSHPNHPKIEWLEIQISETLQNVDSMVLHQSKIYSDYLTKAIGETMMIGANYVSPIIPAIFSVKIFISDLVHSLLKLIVDTYSAFLILLKKIVPSQGNYIPHWNWLHCRYIILRSVSVMDKSRSYSRRYSQCYYEYRSA